MIKPKYPIEIMRSLMELDDAQVGVGIALSENARTKAAQSAGRETIKLAGMTTKLPTDVAAHVTYHNVEKALAYRFDAYGKLVEAMLTADFYMHIHNVPGKPEVIAIADYDFPGNVSNTMRLIRIIDILQSTTLAELRNGRYSCLDSILSDDLNGEYGSNIFDYNEKTMQILMLKHEDAIALKGWVVQGANARAKYIEEERLVESAVKHYAALVQSKLEKEGIRFKPFFSHIK
jgi:hypothetical protein